MEITLRHWQTQDAPALQQLCADVDRSYLSDRLPSPYTLEDARQWLSYVRIREEERQGIFRAIWADGRIPRLQRPRGWPAYPSLPPFTTNYAAFLLFKRRTANSAR